MPKSFAIAVKSPQTCLPSELADFTAFVAAGAEVARAGLEGRVSNAYSLLFLRENSCLLGIGALKSPLSTYSASVFKKAAATLPATQYPLELGWVFVLPSARGKGLSHRLVQAALDRAGDRQVFATARSDNLRIHASLHAASFARHGSEYPSNRGPHRLVLFLHTVPAQ